ncbi:nitrile hydratase subunit beta [Candidatus Poribacteria bacterium]|jgi:nitrile hydratase subunit beta|nr:nitrile hydratase subunit beta [Candidatus Poribacteria bacterium]MBT5534608.1 nitrile hydratase subunit beta [Candidatus Poribacteria bacterium]MBT5714833.1 nitrile hydratase subunit beta [Candidatus Poribacteria bacterium]MBT7099155.1 nitrile hydratase subunit beta [Candidatus Poribacteria bacterium]MBT7806821.1 nitrile hydratase subunit beta [Candidatus Poribacteria bacterium]
MTGRYAAGATVQVRHGSMSGHYRTPAYVQGKIGSVVRLHGEFPNPESRAYGATGLPEQPLYMVRFRQHDLWGDYSGESADSVVIDLFEHWLAPAEEQDV